MGVSKNMGKTPNHPFVHRVWNHYFHHPFSGTPTFWKHPNEGTRGVFVCLDERQMFDPGIKGEKREVKQNTGYSCSHEF